MTIGEAIKRIEDPRLLVGKGQYVADLGVPGMLEAYVVRSPYAHARIHSIDSAALRAAASYKKSVVTVVTARDLPPNLRPIPMRLTPAPELEHALQMPLAGNIVRYVGEPVAVIVADSRYAAEDAAEQLLIEYEMLPAVVDIHKALRADAPLVHPRLGSNDIYTIVSKKGDASEALRRSPHRLSLASPGYCIQRHAAVPLETRGLLAIPAAGGRIHIYGPTKVVHFNRTVLASLLNCDPALIHFIETDVGGGFGARGEFYPEDFLIPFIARQLGRPLRWIEDRMEHLKATNHSREQSHCLTVGFDDSGKLLALEDEIWVNTGAYIRTHGVTVPDLTQALLPGPYDWPAFHLLTHVVVTNKTPLGTYRGPGRYEGTFVRERLIESVAHMLHLDPTLVRERNFINSEQMPYTIGTNALGEPIVFDSGDYNRLLAIAKQHWAKATHDKSGNPAWGAGNEERPYADFAERKSRARQQGRLRGIGWSFFVEKSGLGPWEDARVGLDSEGIFYCYSGLAALGQGTETILAQLFSDRIGVRPQQIKIIHGDTDLVPAGNGSFASRGTATGGVATYLAAEELRKRILTVAAHYFEASAMDVQLGPQGPHIAGSPTKSMDWRQVAAHAGQMRVEAVGAGVEQGRDGELASARGVGELASAPTAPASTELDVPVRYDVPHMTYPYGVHVAEVDIDAGTGHVHIERYLIVYDVGRAVNPILVKGQLVGGMAQGLGGALLEELAYDDAGQLLSGTFMDYLLPGACEVPDVEVIITEDAPSRHNPLGIKGSGEGGTTGVGAAIANAIANALDAPPEAFTQLPIRPEMVLAWLRCFERSDYDRSAH